MGKLAVFVALGIATWLGDAWVIMLNVGIVHRDWWHQVPVMSYHVALIFSGVIVAVPILAAFIKGFVEAADN
jgi:hypothetical protein